VLLLSGLWLRLPNSVTSPLFSNLYFGLKSTNALNTNFFLLPTKLSYTTAQPTQLHSTCSTAQPDLCSTPRGTRFSSVVALSRPPTSSLKLPIAHFAIHPSSHLWNQLPVSFRQPCIKHAADDVTLSNSSRTCSPLSPSITHSLFHSRLKTHFLHKSFPT